MQGHLSSMGVKVKRQDLRESIHRVDHDNVMKRRRFTIKHRTYSVPHPNYLWHLDSNHKLIKINGNLFFMLQLMAFHIR